MGPIDTIPFSATPLTNDTPCPLATVLADRLRTARQELTTRWLSRIVQRIELDAQHVFPTDELLDHMPLLIDGIAAFVDDPAHTVVADMSVVAKAMELGALRHAQGFDAHQLLKEYELLGGILFSYLARTAEDGDGETCTPGELFTCAQRVFQAIAIVQQATMNEYLRRTAERSSERDGRLRAFNRTIAHELRNRIGAAAGAAQLLESVALGTEEQVALAGVVARNVGNMRTTLEHLLELSRVDQTDARQQRHVHLPSAAAEAARQLRELARAHGVEVHVAPLPDVEVNAAAVELCLVNLVSNAVKYSDPTKVERWVEVRGEVQDAEVIVHVRDNGLGVPPDQRDGLFGRFFRAHEHSAQHIEGTGLGLSIVRETVRALGGRVWASFPDVGTEFAFALPARRAEER